MTEITAPEPNPESDVLTDEELATAGATAEDAAPIEPREDDPTTSHEAPEA